MRAYNAMKDLLAHSVFIRLNRGAIPLFLLIYACVALAMLGAKADSPAMFTVGSLTFPLPEGWRVEEAGKDEILLKPRNLSEDQLVFLAINAGEPVEQYDLSEAFAHNTLQFGGVSPRLPSTFGVAAAVAGGRPVRLIEGSMMPDGANRSYGLMIGIDTGTHVQLLYFMAVEEEMYPRFRAGVLAWLDRVALANGNGTPLGLGQIVKEKSGFIE